MTQATPDETRTSASIPSPPRIIAWELTRRCPLNCRHCRAAAVDKPHPGELSTEQAIALLDNIASFARPLMILTGGEPLLRPDVFDLADHARNLGLPAAIALCGAGLDDDIAARIRHAGIRAVSVSLDGPDSVSHDDFRRSPGAFDAALAGIATLRRQNL
ncbi:MAG: radical SAM protein, partial [Sedimentisphaerales bacterium]|nr:radical SAM protein [Sedimentisphaerales bacterium]